jgi:flagellar hook-basal body complex protein FliE
MEIDRVLAQIRALSAQTKFGVESPAVAKPTGGAPSEFAKLMTHGLDAVNKTQQNAASLATRFERGEPGVELAQVMLESQKANVAFRAATEVRNKLVDAYQQIMNMPI